MSEMPNLFEHFRARGPYIKQEFGVTEVVELRSSRVTDAADASLFWPLND